MYIQKFFFMSHYSLLLFFSWSKSKCVTPGLVCLYSFYYSFTVDVAVNKNINHDKYKTESSISVW